MIRLSTLALATALMAFASTAMAQERVQAGILDCRGSTTSFVVGSVTQLGCTFRPTAGPPEAYHATIRRFGMEPPGSPDRWNHERISQTGGPVGFWGGRLQCSYYY